MTNEAKLADHLRTKAAAICRHADPRCGNDTSMTYSTKNEHGVYTDRETIVLERKKAGWRGVPCAEIRLANTPEGWRASHSFSFFTGNWWASSSPITDHDKPHPTREAAIEAEAERLRKHISGARCIEPCMEPERAQMLAWLDSLVPDQLDLFGAAA